MAPLGRSSGGAIWAIIDILGSPHETENLERYGFRCGLGQTSATSVSLRYTLKLSTGHRDDPETAPNQCDLT